MGKHGGHGHGHGAHFGGHSHTGHFGHHGVGMHHHHSRGGGGSPGGASFQIVADMQASIQIFNLDNGILTSSGSQMLFNGKINQLTYEQTQSITQLNLTIVGQKVQATNSCCLISTFIAGACLIFPFILMCFQWWKDKVHPKYAINIRTYEDIVNLIKKCPQATFLNLVVIDNNITKSKLETLSQGIFQGSISRFNLINQTLQSNHQDKQYDNFEQNVQSFRRLNLKACQLQWSNKVIYMSLDNGTNPIPNQFSAMQFQNVQNNKQSNGQIQKF